MLLEKKITRHLEVEWTLIAICEMHLYIEEKIVLTRSSSHFQILGLSNLIPERLSMSHHMICGTELLQDEVHCTYYSVNVTIPICYPSIFSLWPSKYYSPLIKM